MKYPIVCAGILLMAGLANTRGVTQPDETASLLRKPVPEKEAVVWYVGHDSFAVKTKTHLLIFDPLNTGMENSYRLPESADSLSTGVVNPDTIKDLDVVVFTSSMYDDHYATGIWPWKKYIQKITYVFGWDPIINQDNHEYIYMKPREEKAIDGMQVTTMQSTTSGTGFLVKVDGLVLFHGGTHIMLGPAMKRRFTREIDFLAGRTRQCDIAFLEFQTGPGKRPPSIASGIWYADRKLAPRAVIPMGAMNGDVPFGQRSGNAGRRASVTYEDLIPDLIKEAPSDAVRSKIVETGKRGSLFLYRDGKIVKQ